MVTQRADLTFKHNLTQGRHGWLRLTPAYSVKMVQDILARVNKPQRVLDPFSGTGTTGVVCAEQGVACDLVELNPFSVWLAQVKTHRYTSEDLEAARQLARTVSKQTHAKKNLWLPPINHIERWWTTERLNILAQIFDGLRKARERDDSTPSLNLNLIAFCRIAIDWSNATFNHQSMSFKAAQPTLFAQNERELMLEDFLRHAEQLMVSARQLLVECVTVYQGDARCVHTVVTKQYDCVITSPPYPNRMSYIRELRPYMYWLGYLNEAREAGDLDWEAIGGTWGIATSRLAQWTPNGATIDYTGFATMIQRIAVQSPLLANYVHKYFADMLTHFTHLGHVLSSGAKIFYVVGNSKFYDTLVPVEQIYVSLLKQCGFVNARSELLRKRNSKKELFEFVVSAEQP